MHNCYLACIVFKPIKVNLNVKNTELQHGSQGISFYSYTSFYRQFCISMTRESDESRILFSNDRIFQRQGNRKQSFWNWTEATLSLVITVTRLTCTTGRGGEWRSSGVVHRHSYTHSVLYLLYLVIELGIHRYTAYNFLLVLKFN